MYHRFMIHCQARPEYLNSTVLLSGLGAFQCGIRCRRGREGARHAQLLGRYGRGTPKRSLPSQSLFWDNAVIRAFAKLQAQSARYNWFLSA
jgi:hypothetical protein